MKKETSERPQPKPVAKLRPGPVTRNPYLNFCRDFRKKHCGLTAVQIVQRAAAAWKNLTDQDRVKYIVDAFYAKRRVKSKRSSSKRLCHRVKSVRKYRRSRSDFF